MTPVQRFLPPSYSDGLQAPRRSILGRSLPSPREVSASVHEDRDVETASVTHLLMQWGQFIDHDVTSTSQSRGFNGSVPRCCKDGGREFVSKELMHPECMPIPVPASDAFYGPLGVRCLEFVRSSAAARDDCALGWREQSNQVSAYLDASPLYGSSSRQSDRLRLFRNGMLQYGRVQQRKPLLPPERSKKDELCREGAVSADCFKSGDNRVNEHPGLVAAHIVWLRQHNRMATELSHLNPHWSDEKIYQETRKIVGAMIQHITYREFLPIVLGSEVMRLFELELQKKGYYSGYGAKVNPSPASSFGSAAFRFGHSLVQASMVRFDTHHRPMHNNVSLHDELSNPSNIWSAGAVDRLLLGMLNQRIQKRDEFITSELTNRLFQTPQFPFGMDLAAINIQRGRDHGVPAYTAWRGPCGLTEISSFQDLFRVMPSRAVRKLQELYRHVDDVDLFTGGMAERPVVGGLVGPTFACVIAQQFSNLRKGDRFWYENGGFDSSFTPAQLQQIRRVTLAQILCKTLDSIETIQPFVFLSADQRDNRRTSCSNGLLNNFDLSPWIEIDSTFDNDISHEKQNVRKKPNKQNKRPVSRPTLLQTTTVHARPKPTMTTFMTDKSITEDKTTLHDITHKPEKHDNIKPRPVKIDDKLDFKNKTRRYDDPTYQDVEEAGPQKHYPDYDEDEEEIFQQAVVVNNKPYRHKPHSYDKPVIEVTENIDKFTYLINYVPRSSVRPTSRPWRQTARPNNDRDVIKVTYQNYDDTYGRPQHNYGNNYHYFNRDSDSSDDFDIKSDLKPTKHTDSRPYLRKDDVKTDKTETNERATKTYDETTTELLKLVTFSHLGTYNSKFENDKDMTDKNYGELTDKKYLNDGKNWDNKGKQEVTTNTPPRLSTFYLDSKDLMPLTKPDNIDMTPKSKLSTDKITVTTPKYFYAANVRHKYSDVDTKLMKLTKADNIETEFDKPFIGGNYNNPRQDMTEGVQERSSVDSLDFEMNPKTEEKEGKLRIVKPNEKPTHSVAFEVIPSENSPSTWAVYEEKSELQDGVPSVMPSIFSDPLALSELPRPINLNFGFRNKKKKPQT